MCWARKPEARLGNAHRRRAEVQGGKKGAVAEIMRRLCCRMGDAVGGVGVGSPLSR